MADKAGKQRSVKDLSTKKKVTLRQVASWLFTKDPYITDETVNQEFDKLDVPHDKFMRKDASHYRTLYRQGRLPPCPEHDPRVDAQIEAP
jgi:hypothetical protein